MNQSTLFENAGDNRDTYAGNVGEDRISSTAEVRELAREYFNLPEAEASLESPLIRAKREQAARNSGAWRRGMVAKWAPYDTARGYISIHDPVNGEWHDVTYKDAPDWTKWEVRQRAEIYRGGDRHAYDLTSAQMHEIWKREYQPDEGIVEEHPIEEGAEG